MPILLGATATSGWDVVLCLVLLVIATLPLFTTGLGRWIAGIACAVSAGCFAVSVAARPPVDGHVPAKNLPSRESDDGYVSSRACRSCHPAEYASWHRTFHRTMTQPATPQAVLAPFDDVRLQAYGRSCRLSREGDAFFVEMVDPDWEVRWIRRGADPLKDPDPPRVKRRIVMTTGSHHYQAFWTTQLESTMLRQLPFVYLLKERRWIPREDAFLRPNVGRQFVEWNTVCIQCHAVAGQPRHDIETNRLYSRVAELGIACESCHGPGEVHGRRYRNPLARYQRRLAEASDDGIVNPKRLDHRASSEVCGQCHATFFPKSNDDWWDYGYSRSYRPGEPLKDSRHLLHFETKPADRKMAEWLKKTHGSMESHFWPDGTSRVGGREFLGLKASGCYQRGTMSCLSCHSMHHSDPDDQLSAGMRGNRACLQCHENYVGERLREHTHHPAGSTGSLCYNCHMPHTTYALFKGIRSHRVDSPRVAADVANGKPNACNLCHLDQSLQWTADNLKRWYGRRPPELPKNDRNIAAGVVWLLKGNAATRAITAWHFGWRPAQQASRTVWMAPFLAETLNDSYSAVRMVAGRSLKTLPGFGDVPCDFLAAEPERVRLRDKVRKLWKAQTPARKRPPALPIRPDGTPDAAIIERLLRERDRRPITISE